MEGNLEWLKFRDDWFDVLLALSKPEMDRLLTAIRDFTNDRKVPEMSGRESFPWILIKAELEKDKTSRRKAADAHREAGAKGGRPKVEKTNEVIEETKKTKMVFDKPNEIIENQNNQIALIKELRVKEVKSKENNNIAETVVSAQVKQEKQKLTPSDREYWRAFGNNAELAEAFYTASGISPAGDFARWQKDLKQFAEAGITPDVLRRAVNKMRSDKLTIYAPSSVYKVAKSLQAQPTVTQRTFADIAADYDRQSTPVIEQVWDIDL